MSLQIQIQKQTNKITNKGRLHFEARVSLQIQIQIQTNEITNTGRLYCGARVALGETAFLLCAAAPGQAGQLALTIHMWRHHHHRRRHHRQHFHRQRGVIIIKKRRKKLKVSILLPCCHMGPFLYPH